MGVFVFCFEHFVLGLSGLLSVIVPDVPSDVKIQISRERFLEREILFDQDEEENDSVVGMEDLIKENMKGSSQNLRIRKVTPIVGMDDLEGLPGTPETARISSSS